MFIIFVYLLLRDISLGILVSNSLIFILLRMVTTEFTIEKCFPAKYLHED